jgi:hypothetical protein
MFSRHYVPLLQVIAALGKNELQIATWLCINVFKIMSTEVMDRPSIPTACWRPKLANGTKLVIYVFL